MSENQPSELTPARAAELTADGSHLLVDVREDSEWEAGHAPQAVHVPLGTLAAVDLPAGTPVVAVCRSGARSARAVEALAERGIEAHNLTGGMTAWAAAGLEVRDGRGQPGTVV
ncbi:rhodanese-like domain-containing protein [Rhodococcus aerolatus]